MVKKKAAELNKSEDDNQEWKERVLLSEDMTKEINLIIDDKDEVMRDMREDALLLKTAKKTWM